MDKTKITSFVNQILLYFGFQIKSLRNRQIIGSLIYQMA